MSLRIPAYRRLWIGGLLNFSGMPMQAVARGFLAFELTGRNSALGLVMLAMGLPMLVFTPIGGLAADRLPKRTVLLVAAALMAASSAGVAIALIADGLAFWMLVAAAVVQGAAFAVMAPSRLAFTAELVGRERLMNAIVLAQLSANATRVIGPSLAGAMLGVALFGARGVYVVVTIMFVLTFILTLTLPEGRPDRTSQHSAARDVLDGLAYVAGNPHVLLPAAMSITVVATAFPYVAFLPSLVDEVFHEGPGWLGALSSAGAVGAVIASLTIAKYARRSVTDRSMAFTAFAFGGLVILLGVTPNIWAALVVVTLAGAANAGFQALNNSLVLLRADSEYHGRVQSLLMLGFSVFGLFAAPLGVLADHVGLRTTLVAMGTFSVASVAAIQLLAIRAGAGTTATTVRPRRPEQPPPAIRLPVMRCLDLRRNVNGCPPLPTSHEDACGRRASDDSPI